MKSYPKCFSRRPRCAYPTPRLHRDEGVPADAAKRHIRDGAVVFPMLPIDRDSPADLGKNFINRSAMCIPGDCTRIMAVGTSCPCMHTVKVRRRRRDRSTSSPGVLALVDGSGQSVCEASAATPAVCGCIKGDSR
jgi:hypothetical protein